jgi:hypothetical protein
MIEDEIGYQLSLIYQVHVPNIEMEKVFESSGFDKTYFFK